MDDLGRGQLPIPMVRYPHMMPQDTIVWTKFLTEQQFGIKEVWYDVHVGKPIGILEGQGQIITKIAKGITRKRIDVIAAVGGGYWVVEVKPRADSQAIGQVMSYKRLFERQYKPPGMVIPIIIADEIDPDIEDLIDEIGVGVILNGAEK